MRYLIFSDTHLTPTFEPAKFQILREAVTHADRVIINGDFWEGFAGTFDQFVCSPWAKELFPLLLKKKAVYLFGNHDPKRLSDKRVSLFSVEQGDRYEFVSGKNRYVVEHGNRLIRFPDLSAPMRHILEHIEDAVFRVMGKTFIRVAYKRFNDRIKRKIRGEYKANEYLITGHTHYAEIDLENHYINGGFNNYGLSQYLFIEDGVVTPVEKTYW